MRITKAMLLSAGFGTRLKPLTLTTPKPLLKLDGAVLIDHQLKFLANFGIREVVINLHHLGEKIRGHVGEGSHLGVSVFYSYEPQILGTGGGIKKAQHFFDEKPFVVLNSDTLIAIDLSQVVSHHFESGAAATMVVKELVHDEHNPVLVDAGGLVKGFGRGGHFYTGLQIIGPEMLSILPPDGVPACLIEDGYKKLLKEGRRVAAFLHDGYFNDLGTPERYNQARQDVALGKFKLSI